MEKQALSDPGVYPTEKVIASHLKEANAAFVALFAYNHDTHPEFTERWKFYNDGKQWLMNVSTKKKTVFWLALNKGSFRTAFYLSQKHEPLVLESDLPASLKKQYKASAGKSFRAIRIVIRTKKDIAAYKKVLQLKLETL